MPGNIVAKVISTDAGRDEVEDLLTASRDAVRTMLTDNRHIVEALRDALLEHDELVAEEIGEVIVRAVPQPA
jgi:ATP-dependent Zn protease